MTGIPVEEAGGGVTGRTLTYPALFTTADTASKSAQRWYFTVVGIEYCLLILAAILSLNFSEEREYYATYAFVFIGTLACLVYRIGWKPEQAWYQCRALAESVKTATWRFVMRAHPFDGEVVTSRVAFRENLKDTLDSNRHIGHTLAGATTGGSQTTDDMETIRAMRWEERRLYYLEHRVDEQGKWYNTQARKNSRRAFWFGVVGVVIYLLALALVIARVVWPTVKLCPIAPMIVLASAILGWMQIRKFNELASVYTLTGHEIQLIQDKIREVDKATDLSEFVNDAELAFSREHTQWTARQTGKY